MVELSWGVGVMDNRSHNLHDEITTEAFKNGTFSASISTRSNLLYYILISSFGVIITISNLAVLISSCTALKRGKEGKCVYFLLGNIALAASVNGIIVTFVQVLPESLKNERICLWQIGQVLAGALVSIYCIVLIAIDRFLYILYGLQYQRWVHLLKLQAVLVVIWILGCIIGYLPLMGWSGDAKNGHECWFVIVVPKNLIITTVVLSTIPLLLVIFLYSIILFNSLKGFIKPQIAQKGKTTSQDSTISRLRAFRHQTTQLPNPDHNVKGIVSQIFKKKFEKSVSTSKRWKSIKVVIFPTASFFFSWYLYMIVSLYYVTACNDYSTKRCKSLILVLASPLSVLAFVNSLLHPVLYAWWHKGFNRFIKRRVSSFGLKDARQGNRIVPNTYRNTIALQKSNESIDNV